MSLNPPKKCIKGTVNYKVGNNNGLHDDLDKKQY